MITVIIRYCYWPGHGDDLVLLLCDLGDSVVSGVILVIIGFSFRCYHGGDQLELLFA